ncbi:mating-type HMG-box protein MAT1-2 [Aspergillus steynii IBT 23096]|uniref:Mating-type HMG-box protein MAT1-2 n=1 Tax=Aspergillus steynii IBT 23096 TaxID=1392250 RepID=A0A2I2GFL4_9EURO|nr:mating-type HMG-box protein MAT1-2 [Aspergillus steynii IBT 23096]PLB51676.1 mating-type HMG-box protein MAT1-2 [Aspergillus steynii IBT 23096]
MAAVPIAMKSTVESTDKLTELLWQDALGNLQSTNNEVLLPINIVDMIGQCNVDKIKARLGALIGAPVVAFVDESINALRVMRTPAFSGTAISVACHDRTLRFEHEAIASATNVQGKTGIPAKPAKVPRPPNAFILYRQHHHPKVKEAYPAFSNNEISVILGKQWKAETEDVKMQFRHQAEDLKRKHAEEHPDYHYSPRKPSERKRRASSRQHTKTGQSAKSPISTNDASDASTPGMYSEMEMPMPLNDGLAGIDMIMPEQQFEFDHEAFDNLLQQVQEDYGRANPFSESFEFSDFVADYY